MRDMTDSIELQRSILHQLPYSWPELDWYHRMIAIADERKRREVKWGNIEADHEIARYFVENSCYFTKDGKIIPIE